MSTKLQIIPFVLIFIATHIHMHIVSWQAKEGSLAIEEMDGGTFTVSNGGVFGSMFGTPIINPPQSAILGMHGVFDRPVAIDGKVIQYSLQLLILIWINDWQATLFIQ